MSFNTEQHTRINHMSFDFAASTFLSFYSEDELASWIGGEMSDEEFLGSTDTGVWEPFENYPLEDVAINIVNLAGDFYEFAKQIADLLQPATTTN